jgi:chromosome segregation ATPase
LSDEEAAEVVKQLASMQRFLGTLATKDDLAATNAAVGALRGDLATTSAAVGALRGDLATTSAAVGALRGDLATTSAAVGAIKVNLQATTATVEATNARFGATGAKCEALKADLQAINRQLARMHRKTGELEEGMAETAVRISQYMRAGRAEHSKAGRVAKR